MFFFFLSKVVSEKGGNCILKIEKALSVFPAEEFIFGSDAQSEGEGIYFEGMDFACHL